MLFGERVGGLSVSAIVNQFRIKDHRLAPREPDLRPCIRSDNRNIAVGRIVLRPDRWLDEEYAIHEL